MKKRYTIEEIKKIFEEASEATLKTLRSEFVKHLENEKNTKDPLQIFAFEAQNMLAIASFKRKFYNFLNLLEK
jgi:hypothetical protein